MTDKENAPDDGGLYLFGKDVSQIPCFRNSFLYGISAGVGTGFLAFITNSRPQRSTHIGFGTFFGVTIGYWFYCRYNFSKTNFELAQLKRALQHHVMYEGTELEKEIRAKSTEA